MAVIEVIPVVLLLNLNEIYCPGDVHVDEHSILYTASERLADSEIYWTQKVARDWFYGEGFLTLGWIWSCDQSPRVTSMPAQSPVCNNIIRAHGGWRA